MNPCNLVNPALPLLDPLGRRVVHFIQCTSCTMYNVQCIQCTMYTIYNATTVSILNLNGCLQDARRSRSRNRLHGLLLVKPKQYDGLSKPLRYPLSSAIRHVPVFHARGLLVSP